MFEFILELELLAAQPDVLLAVTLLVGTLFGAELLKTFEKTRHTK